MVTAQSVCRSWLRVGQDELLWKAMFKRDWNISPNLGIAPGKTLLPSLLTQNVIYTIPGQTSWYREYMRLWRHIPLYETEELRGHTHQVLHVSFSHNGKYFATCSKDGYILVRLNFWRLFLLEISLNSTTNSYFYSCGILGSLLGSSTTLT